ncbi:hypothetical protein Cma02nite_27350 [Cellulomonas marina]|nr:hypothetical protein Cma02nite_27350 [Cellulomonas marina]
MKRYEGGPLHDEQADVPDGHVGEPAPTPVPVTGGRYLYGPGHELSDRGDVEQILLWEAAGTTLDLGLHSSTGEGPGAN